MAHFAEIDDNNIVIRVLVVPDSEEHRGQDYLSLDLGLGGFWLKTSYNTHQGVHTDPDTNLADGGVAFRGNFAGAGYFYDAERDAFLPPKPFPSWVLNEATYWYEPPFPPPNDDFVWDEDSLSWVEADEEPDYEVE